MTGDVVVRRAGVGDVEVLTELRLRFVAAVTRRDPVDASVRARSRAFYQKSLADGSHVAWLAERDREAIGCCGVSLIPIPPRGTLDARHDGLVLTVWVEPRHRGHGLARQLMEALLAARDELSIHRLMLKATDIGRPLYESLGFTNPDDVLVLGERTGRER